MKYRQLTSVMRGRHAAIRKVAKQKAEWRFLVEWVSADAQIVQTQDREKLDFVLDDAFVRAVLRKCPVRFYLTRDQQLCSRRRSLLDKSLSARRAFDRYGGDALEEALESGSVKVGHAPSPPEARASESKRVVLRNEKTTTDIRHLSVRGLENGDIVFEGQDLGDAVEAFFGYREHEWAWTIKASDVPKLEAALGARSDLLAAIQDRFSLGRANEIEPFLKQHAIPYQTWTRIGD